MGFFIKKTADLLFEHGGIRLDIERTVAGAVVRPAEDDNADLAVDAHGAGVENVLVDQAGGVKTKALRVGGFAEGVLAGGAFAVVDHKDVVVGRGGGGSFLLGIAKN